VTIISPDKGSREFSQEYVNLGLYCYCKVTLECSFWFYKFDQDRIQKWRDSEKHDVFTNFKRKHGDKFALLSNKKNEHSLEPNPYSPQELEYWKDQYLKLKNSK
jgi:hypothetical protein